MPDDFDEYETDTGQYRVFADGRLYRVEPDGTMTPADDDPRDECAPNDWADSQRIMLGIVSRHMDRQTDAVVRLGDELPGTVSRMGTDIAKELRTGLRNQSIAFFLAFMTLIVALVVLAGYQLRVRAGSFEVGGGAHAAPSAAQPDRQPSRPPAP